MNFKPRYSPTSVVDWFHRTLGVNNQPGDEIQTDCPKCGGDKLYFNYKKQIGKCHKASCEWHHHVTMKQLIEIVGFAPNQHGEWEPDEAGKQKVVVTLPGHPILIWKDDRMWVSHMGALNYLHSRGLTDQLILNFKLTCDRERIYVPIYHEGNLVNYNSRVLPLYDVEGGKKYLYCSGVETSKYIFGWNECQDWEDLALVENTFVSLAYRYRMHCSTSFGSNLSDAQAGLIAESKVRVVALLWDENAWRGADAAVKRLNNDGIAAAYWKILGQPDDYPIEWVEEKANLVKQAARDGVPFLDFRDEARISVKGDDDE